MTDPVGNTKFLTELDIRRMLRDFPEANNLLDDYEYTPEEIRQCVTLAVDDWNDMAPAVHNYTIESFPYRSILLKGTITWLLELAAHHSRRNNLTYKAGGGSIADKDEFKDYQPVAKEMRARFEKAMRLKKNEENYAQCWGSC